MLITTAPVETIRLFRKFRKILISTKIVRYPSSVHSVGKSPVSHMGSVFKELKNVHTNGASEMNTIKSIRMYMSILLMISATFISHSP